MRATYDVADSEDSEEHHHLPKDRTIRIVNNLLLPRMRPQRLYSDALGSSPGL